MRLVSWNILAGGGSRCGPIIEVLRRYDADLITLQETVSSRAADICHLLRQGGYRYGFSAPRGPGDRGLCVLSRVPLRRVARRAPPHAGIYPRGWLEVELVEYGVRLAAVYGPAEGPPIGAFWDAAAAWLPRRVERPFVMLGDFNAGASGVDAEGYRFRAGRAFAELSAMGLVDCWRREHGDRREHTWFSRPGRTACRPRVPDRPRLRLAGARRAGDRLPLRSRGPRARLVGPLAAGDGPGARGLSVTARAERGRGYAFTACLSRWNASISSRFGP